MNSSDQRIQRSSNTISRRSFVQGVAAVGVFDIVPRFVLGGQDHTAPSEKLNIAGIGVGGMGFTNLQAMASENIVALCDVDDEYAAKAFQMFPNATRHRDFRRMLDTQKEIDAVMIATPDHTHAIITLAAMQMGKHVYCEKPLTHTIGEVRMITKAARESNVATQMGNWGHANPDARLINEWIWDGAIGNVRAVHVWTDRPLPYPGWTKRSTRPKETPPVPATLDWDLWLGPAPERPYHPDYLPGVRWRPWFDFGTGALGDSIIHNIEPAYWALGLDKTHPISVHASSTEVYAETYPKASIIHYDYPARGDAPPLTITVYDGGLMPPRPEELGPDRKMRTNGILFEGDKGKLLCGGWSSVPELLPESRMREYKRPPETIPRSEGHRLEWINACKTGNPTGSDFAYASGLTELVLLGNVALRSGRNAQLDWDGPNMKVTNVPEANAFLQKEYRKGWALDA